MLADSRWTISLILGNPRVLRRGSAGASYGLLDIMRTDLFCSLLRILMVLTPQLPQTEDQNLRCGSISPR